MAGCGHVPLRSSGGLVRLSHDGYLVEGILGKVVQIDHAGIDRDALRKVMSHTVLAFTGET